VKGVRGIAKGGKDGDLVPNDKREGGRKNQRDGAK